MRLPCLPSLRETLNVSERSDFCVGYFNLRGWKCIDDLIAKWPGEPGQQCRLLVGMQSLPQEELRNALSITTEQDQLDNQTALRLKKKLADEVWIAHASDGGKLQKTINARQAPSHA